MVRRRSDAPTVVVAVISEEISLLLVDDDAIIPDWVEGLLMDGNELKVVEPVVALLFIPSVPVCKFEDDEEANAVIPPPILVPVEEEGNGKGREGKAVEVDGNNDDDDDEEEEDGVPPLLLLMMDNGKIVGTVEGVLPVIDKGKRVGGKVPLMVPKGPPRNRKLLLVLLRRVFDTGSKEDGPPTLPPPSGVADGGGKNGGNEGRRGTFGSKLVNGNNPGNVAVVGNNDVPVDERGGKRVDAVALLLLGILLILWGFGNVVIVVGKEGAPGRPTVFRGNIAGGPELPGRIFSGNIGRGCMVKE